MKPTCIGCGCRKEHACPQISMEDFRIAITHGDVQEAVGCFWLRYAGEVGVCSACEDLVAGWDTSTKNRALILPLIAERFHRQVLFVHAEASSALAWVLAAQPVLGGRSPRECILAGELDRVHAIVEALRSGAFV
jgi:hypothetical protein